MQQRTCGRARTAVGAVDRSFSSVPTTMRRERERESPSRSKILCSFFPLRKEKERERERERERETLDGGKRDKVWLLAWRLRLASALRQKKWRPRLEMMMPRPLLAIVCKLWAKYAHTHAEKGGRTMLDELAAQPKDPCHAELLLLMLDGCCCCCPDEAAR